MVTPETVWLLMQLAGAVLIVVSTGVMSMVCLILVIVYLRMRDTEK